MCRSMIPRVVAIAGGKGGVGKSLVAANVGIFLATLGKRVILVDAAFGAANLHIFAGVPRPSRTLSEALVEGGPGLAELAVPTYVPGVKLIGGVYDPPWVAEPAPAQVERIVEQIRALPADWVVVDLGPGLAAASLELFLAADVQVIVAVPDPTSIELMHRFTKAVFLRSLERRGLAHLAGTESRPSRESRPLRAPGHPGHLEGGAASALEVYLRAVHDQIAEIGALRDAILGFSPHLVINSARSKSDMELGRAVTSAARRRLGTPFRYLGHLEYDEAVWASTRRRRPLLIEHPETRIAKCFERVARGLLAVRPPTPEGDVLPPDSHYELLEVSPTASFEDIRRANRRIRDIYGAADFFCLTAMPDISGRVEGFGLVYLEAAAGGLPSVATAIGGVPDAVVADETGLLVSPSAEAIKDAIRRQLRRQSSNGVPKHWDGQAATRMIEVLMRVETWRQVEAQDSVTA